MADPLLTESLSVPGARRPGEGRERGRAKRKLLSPGQAVPLGFHAPPAPAEEAGDEDRACPGLVPGSSSGDGSCFRWKKMSWPDGGRTNSLEVAGSSLLLSEVGWRRWRGWAAATAGGGGSDSAEEVKGGGDVGVEATPHPEEGGVRSPKPVTGGEAAAAAAADEDGSSLIAELASALDVHLSQSCLVLQPWNYGGGYGRAEGRRDGQKTPETDPSQGCRTGSESFGGGGGDGGGCRNGWDGIGGDGAAVVVRADLSLRMTSAFFLDGHWAARLGGCSSSQLPRPGAVFPPAGSMGRHPEDSSRASLVSCRLERIEAFSRPPGVVGCDAGELRRGGSRCWRPKRGDAARVAALCLPPSATPTQGKKRGCHLLISVSFGVIYLSIGAAHCTLFLACRVMPVFFGRGDFVAFSSRP